MSSAGTYPDVERLFLVTGCQHCAEPPCVPVCPTGATRQRADGLVTMDYDTCIGCGYCAVACPYQARTIAHDTSWYYGEPTAQEAHVAHDERAGVANKCTFCVERVDEAAALGLTPGVDLEYTPACAASCIAQALHFGDFADPDSNVSRLASDNASFQMHAELGTDPQIRYLYDVPNATPGREAEAADTGDAAMANPENPLVGERQTFWDGRAAMNFTLGGLSGGMMAVAGLAALFGMLGAEPLVETYLVAAALMTLGLFFVFLEIGRKLRFLYVLLRPQSSWMTRETYAVAVLYPALALDVVWPHPVLHAVVALAGAAFLYCQAQLLFAGKGVPAWRAPLVPWLIAASGLLEGAGLLAFLTKVMGTGAVRGRGLGDRRAIGRLRRPLAALPQDRRRSGYRAARPRRARRGGAGGDDLRPRRARAPLPARALHRRSDVGLGGRPRRHPRRRRRGALEVHRDYPRLPPAGLRDPDDADARLRHPRRPAPAGADIGTRAASTAPYRPVDRC